MEYLKVQSFGPIEKAEVNFGDLTLLVGPQASGKSIFLQLLKLIVDKHSIMNTLQQYNYIWSENPKNILDIYFGEGMANVWKSNSEIRLNNKEYVKDYLLESNPNDTPEMLFYIPAQRILSISDGRPKNFMEFDVSTPYVLRHFSEILRLYLQNDPGLTSSIFPVNHQLEGQIGRPLTTVFFTEGKLLWTKGQGKRR